MSTWRYIAQRALTGEFLDLDLPLNRDDLAWTLSGAGSLRGTVAPDVGALRDEEGRLLLEEWGTLLYAEADGEIRWGGILVSSGFEGETWSLEAAGFATYPNGLPYVGEWAPTTVDPVVAIRHLWDHVQAQPDGDLGVLVTGAASTPVRLGTADDPYALLWWDSPDVGDEIDSLVKEAPLDYEEVHSWDGDAIRHEIRLGYPRLGRRRYDLAFRQGENVTTVVPVDRHGDDYANGILALGSGEGKTALRAAPAIRDGRLRRVSVLSAKDVTSQGRLDTLARRDLTWRQKQLEIPSITVANHPNAVLGSWSLGDDVLVEAEIPWLGDVAIWHRIVSWSLDDDHTATLTLVRSDTFTYGA